MVWIFPPLLQQHGQPADFLSYRRCCTNLPFIYEARHDRINQFGGTWPRISVPSSSRARRSHGGRKFTVLRAADADGLVRSDTLDWAPRPGFLPADTRFNVQVFQRTYFSHDPNMIADHRENGYTLYLDGKITDSLQAQALLISSFIGPTGCSGPS